MIMEMLGSAQVKDDDEEYQSPLDILFERLEMRNPESIAVKQYAIYKQAAGKTAKSILISVGVRLASFNLKQIANLTCTHELDLYSIGEKKVALFCCIPDADTSLNYLVGMIYSNLFQTLYYVADRKYHGYPGTLHYGSSVRMILSNHEVARKVIIEHCRLFKDWESLIGIATNLYWAAIGGINIGTIGERNTGYQYLGKTKGRGYLFSSSQEGITCS